MQTDQSRRRTLWVVDDSATDAERVRRVLSTEYEIQILTDGAAALERLASGLLPDLLLVDWLMPGMSGIEVCKYVRAASGKLPQIPVILLTAQHGSEEIVEAFRCGANDYVSKPFVDEELRSRVRTLINTKMLLERAEKAEADVRTLLTHAPDPIFAIDANGKITFVNDEGLRAIASPKEAILGAELGTLVPGFGLQAGPEVGRGNRDSSLTSIPDVTIGTRVFSPSVRILPSDGAAVTTVSLRDVTERRKADARRLDFYSIVAHDLRTPITSVLMRIQLAFRGKHGMLPGTLIADLRKIESSLKAQVGLVNDFLDLAKLEGTGYKIERKPVEVSKLIESTMEDFQPLLEKSQLAWLHSDSDATALALGDKPRLAQVLANLIANAIKFTPPEGVITTSVVVGDGHIETSVKDTGRGIAASELPHLFDRFTRASDSAQDTLGTGLGLMIVREIVEAHGGVLGVESEPGVGSRFWFRIPRYEAGALS